MQHFTSLWSALAAVHFLPEWIQKKSFTLQVMNAVWHLLVSILAAFTLSLTKAFYLFLGLLVISHWTNYLSCFWTGWERQELCATFRWIQEGNNNPSNDVGVSREQGFRSEQQVLLDSKLSSLKQINFYCTAIYSLTILFPFWMYSSIHEEAFFLLMFFLLGSTHRT